MKQDQQKDDASGCDPQNPPIVLHAMAHEVNGSIEWGLGTNPDPPPRFMVNLDLKRKSGKHKVIIQLAGNTQGISFNKADPIWVCETGDCPPPAGSASSQIENIECNGNMLSFDDRNDGDERVLTYQLNFVGPNAKPLDPMIRNGGSF